MLKAHIQISGVVQGVGFRPFVARLAGETGVGGTVCNEGGQVLIEACAPADRMDVFLEGLLHQAPATSRIDRISKRVAPVLADEKVPRSFSILESRATDGTVQPVPDIALCEDCLRELFQPENPRYRNAFISCAHCGPRFSILSRIPYDRATTTMQGFPMCARCAAQYADVADRRYHAQTVCCNHCGPTLRWRGRNAVPEDSAEALDAAVRALLDGQVVAVKGIGGFHLACDARQEAPVARLRALKGRESKPFAVMYPTLAALEADCFVNDAEKQLLTGSQRPIVLLRRRPQARIAGEVCTTSSYVGAFLPYAPLQHLLLRETGALVMTSANPSGLPILKDDADALCFFETHEACAGVLYHNRTILRRLDDSVVASVDGGLLTVRRSRGYVPLALPFPHAEGAAVLAYGAQQKSTVCLAGGKNLFPSAEIGDLDNLETCAHYRETIADLQALLRIRPELAVCDLHPAYESVRMAEMDGLPLLRVQHHFAHIASVLAETGQTEPVIGVAFDGTGYGLDGTVWGGEFLIASVKGFRRVGHIKPVRMIGSDRSVRQGWKSAACMLYDAGLMPEANDVRYKLLKAALDTETGTVRSSSMGRVFDAVSALLGICDESTYEGQCAIELENAACRAALHSLPEPLPYALSDQETGVVADLAPCIRQLVHEMKKGAAAETLALRFHQTVCRLIADVCDRLRERYGLRTVALSGGVFQNRLLLESVLPLLAQRGFETAVNHAVPPGDGGISLGQAYIGRWIGLKGEALEQCALPLREN